MGWQFWFLFSTTVLAVMIPAAHWMAAALGDTEDVTQAVWIGNGIVDLPQQRPFDDVAMDDSALEHATSFDDPDALPAERPRPAQVTWQPLAVRDEPMTA